MKPLTSDHIRGNWATLITAWNADDSLDLGRVAAEIDTLIRMRVDGIYSNGTAGEFHTQTEDEFDRISQCLAEKCNAAGMPFQIGVSHMSAQISRERLRRIVSLTPSAVQVILPDWFPVTEDEAVAFLERDGGSGEWHRPRALQPTARQAGLESPEQIGRLAARVPALIGLKTAGGDDVWYASMREQLARLSVFVPGHLLASGVQRGAHGAYSNVACLNPAAAQRWTDQMRTDMRSGAWNWSNGCGGSWTDISPRSSPSRNTATPPATASWPCSAAGPMSASTCAGPIARFRLNPAFFANQFDRKYVTFPDRFELLRQWIENGGHFHMNGGWFSFGGHQGYGRWARCAWQKDTDDRVLAVDCLETDDLIESTASFEVRLADSTHPAVRGIDWSTIPPVLGFNETRPGRGAKVIAEIRHGNAWYPLLAERKVGKGRSTAWTTSASPHWGLNFMKWEHYDRLRRGQPDSSHRPGVDSRVLQAMNQRPLAMTSRERVTAALNFEPPDRLPVNDSLWDGLQADWIQEGMPAGVTPADHFGWDIESMFIDASARFDMKILSRADGFITFEDRAGYTVKKADGRSGTLDFQDYKTKTRDDWENVTKPRMILDDPSCTARIDSTGYFCHFDPYPTWTEAKKKIRHHLRARAVRHVCRLWTVGGDLAASRDG